MYTLIGMCKLITLIFIYTYTVYIKQKSCLEQNSMEIINNAGLSIILNGKSSVQLKELVEVELEDKTFLRTYNSLL